MYKMVPESVKILKTIPKELKKYMKKPSQGKTATKEPEKQ